MSSKSSTQQPTPSPGPKAYNAPSLPYNQRPLPPGWVSQFDPNQQASFYIDEHTNPPTITWEDPRPAYYMAMERAQYAPPPPGIQQGRQQYAPQPQVQQQQVHTVQNSDGTITTITSSGQQPIVIQASPQQQQQQQPVQQQQQSQQQQGPSLGRTLVGAAVVSSLLRPRTTVVAPRRRRF